MQIVVHITVYTQHGSLLIVGKVNGHLMLKVLVRGFKSHALYLYEYGRLDLLDALQT